MQTSFRKQLGPLVFICAVVCLDASSALARPNFVRTVPTPFSCDTCHDDPNMRQWRNGFGIDYATRRAIWATDDDPGLCDLDSDGDGIRNGDELGDPDCNWRPNDRLPNVDATNPGDSRDPNRCGDGVLHPGEACDGADFGEADCIDEGFIGGELRCTAACELDRGECVAAMPDAAPPPPDAAPQMPDASPPAQDVGTPVVDASPIRPDTGVPGADATSDPSDATAGPSEDGSIDGGATDQGAVTLDDLGSSSEGDQGTVDGGGVNDSTPAARPSADDGGCAQGLGESRPIGWLALLFIVGWCRRRR